MKPTVPEVLPAVQRYYARHLTGGSLHIVLDDGNVRDDDVWFCLEWARDHDDEPGTRLALTLLRMSRTQRSKLALSPEKHAPMI